MITSIILLLLNVGQLLCDDLYYLEGTMGGRITRDPDPDQEEVYKATVRGEAAKYNANKVVEAKYPKHAQSTECISDEERKERMRQIWIRENPMHCNKLLCRYDVSIYNDQIINPTAEFPENKKIWFFKWVNLTLMEGRSTYESNYGNDLYTWVEFSRPGRSDYPDQYTRYAFETAKRAGNWWVWELWWYWNWRDVPKDKVTMDVVKSERLTTAHDVVITYWDYSRLGADHKVSQCRLNLGALMRNDHAHGVNQMCSSHENNMIAEVRLYGELDKDLPPMRLNVYNTLTTLLGWPLEGYCNEHLDRYLKDKPEEKPNNNNVDTGPRGPTAKPTKHTYGFTPPPGKKRSLGPARSPSRSRKTQQVEPDLMELIAKQDPYAIFSMDWFKKL